MNQQLAAEHGVICAMPQEFYGYFGWPTVARLDDGTLVVVASGLRTEHVCPFGRTTLCLSRDDGRSWTSPRVVNDSPLDDRDAGVVSLSGRRLLVTWFTIDVRAYYQPPPDPVVRARWEAGLANITDANVARFQGAWARVSEDGGETWRAPVRVPLTTPHGPIRRRSGEVLFFGKEFTTREELDGGAIVAMQSIDDGRTWLRLGTVPVFPGTEYGNYHEPHVVELPAGKLVGMIRVENHPQGVADVTQAGLPTFSLLQTDSADGGRSWSVPRPLGFHGSPPHLLRHSSGVLILTYGYRLEPFGQRVALSRDDGATWDHDFILRADGPDHDLGYPATVELADGRLFTVYYQKPGRQEDKCGLLWSRWRLP